MAVSQKNKNTKVIIIDKNETKPVTKTLNTPELFRAKTWCDEVFAMSHLLLA